MKHLFLMLLFLCAPAYAAETHSLSFAGNDRPYVVHTPPGYNTDLSHPVIIALHGGGGNPQQFMDGSGLNAAGDRAGMLVVYPSGYPGEKIEKLRTWNAGKCCAGAVAAQSDDVGYIRAVLDDLPGYYNIDKSRIYVTGHSNGAMMAYKLSCEMADRIRAIAPVGAQDVTMSCNPARALSVLHIHGTLDNCATYTGGECGGCFAEAFGGKGDSLRWQCAPVPDAVAARAKLYGCAAGPIPTPSSGPVSCQRWKNCRDNASVTLCSINGHGHSWPGGEPLRICERRPNLEFCKNKQGRSGPALDNVSATAMLGDFFMAVK
jgi:polyhydroxybutyrate depolymerase